MNLSFWRCIFVDVCNLVGVCSLEGSRVIVVIF